MFFRSTTPATLLILAGAILFIFPTISVPVSKKFYLLSSTVDVFEDEKLLLGMWGWCLDSACSTTKLGFSISDLEDSLGTSTNVLSNTLVKGLTYVFVLHPVAVGLGGLAFIFGLLTHCFDHGFNILTSLCSGLATSVGVAIVIFDFIVLSIAKNRLNDSDVASDSQLGNAVWLALAGAICYILAGCAFSLAQCCSCRSPRGRSKAYDDEEDAMRYNPPVTFAPNAYGATGYNNDPYHYGNYDETYPLATHPQSVGKNSIAGVGVGYGRRDSDGINGSTPTFSRTNTGYSTRHSVYSRDNDIDQNPLPPHISAFQSMDGPSHTAAYPDPADAYHDPTAAYHDPTGAMYHDPTRDSIQSHYYDPPVTAGPHSPDAAVAMPTPKLSAINTSNITGPTSPTPLPRYASPTSHNLPYDGVDARTEASHSVYAPTPVLTNHPGGWSAPNNTKQTSHAAALGAYSSDGNLRYNQTGQDLPSYASNYNDVTREPSVVHANLYDQSQRDTIQSPIDGHPYRY